MNVALKLDLVLILFWLITAGGFRLLDIKLDWWIVFVLFAGTIILTHLAFYLKVIKPLNVFIKVADKIADGETENSLEELKLSDLEEVQGSFVKIVSSMIESKVAIEDYISKISQINKELEKKVDSLSILYSASQTMGGSLNLDTLSRNLINTFIERLELAGSAVMIYNSKTDLVSVKDLIGFSPDLFAKFRFYSDHNIVSNTLQDGFWAPDEHELEIFKAEFDTDSVRDLRCFMPMRIKDHFVGILVTGAKTDGQGFDDAEIQFLKALAGLASTSINNANLFEKSEATKNELDHKVFNLMTLQQSGKVLSSTLDLEELIKISIDMFLETVWANKGILMLMADDKPELEVKAKKGITDQELEDLKTNPAESWAMTTLEKEKKPILLKELKGEDSVQNYSIVNKDLPFAVYIPMLKEGDLYGVVKIGEKINGEDFNENDLEFFATISSQAVIAFENARLYSLAITDSITKLYLHRYFQLRLEEEISRSRRYNATISLLMCDLDHFKSINDNYGHQQGDLILKEISKILKKNVRNTDIAARYGGEEFSIILPETTQSDARIVAERIRRDVHKFEFPSIVAGQPHLNCTISIGVAGFPLNANDKDELIQKADGALYKAKAKGRNKVVLCGVE